MDLKSKILAPAVLGAAGVGGLVYFLQKYTPAPKKKEYDAQTDVNFEEIEEEFKKVQDHICEFLEKTTDQKFFEDKWNYTKGTGGGISRVWEGKFPDVEDYNDADFWKKENVLEKGGVNFSGIHGSSLAPSAATSLKIPQGTPYRVTGVSLVIHPKSPHIPTIHMNIRYFEAGDVWWFGGGIDVTPNYPKLDQVIDFHLALKELCEKHNFDYKAYKDECDKYFWITHRNENRGIGGIFFDQVRTASVKKSKRDIFNFVKSLGYAFSDLYRPFLEPSKNLASYTKEQRDFQLLRRGRYAEFNLVIDRGTKFGFQSEGRVESILMSLPAIVKWKYNWKPEPNSPEAQFMDFYLKPQDWVNMKKSEKSEVAPATTSS